MKSSEIGLPMLIMGGVVAWLLIDKLSRPKPGLSETYPASVIDPGILRSGVSGRTHQWMQTAVKRPGALHRDLGIAEGRRIPTAMLLAHASDPGIVGKRARLALRFRGM